MNTVYCNNKTLLAQIPLLASPTWDTAAVAVWDMALCLKEDTFVEALKCALERAERTIFITDSKDVAEIVQALGPETVTVVPHATAVRDILLEEFLPAIPTIMDFVQGSISNLKVSVDSEEVARLCEAFKTSLNNHSVLTCIVAFHEMLLHSKTINTYTYGVIILYVAKIYRSVERAENSFAAHNSHYLSIMSAEIFLVDSCGEGEERLTLYRMLQPLEGDIATTLHRTKEV